MKEFLFIILVESAIDIINDFKKNNLALWQGFLFIIFVKAMIVIENRIQAVVPMKHQMTSHWLVLHNSP